MLFRQFLFLILALSLSASTVAQAEDVVRLANGEWPPYHSSKLPHYGIASRIITEAFATRNIKVEYVFMPWKRGMQMAIDGKLDGTGVWRRKAEFERDFYYSDPIIMSQTVFFHLKSNEFDWKTFEDLKDYRIGGTIGYGYNDDYDRAERSGQFSISRVKSDETNFRMLLAGHIDVFPVTTEVGYFILQQKFTSAERQQIIHHPRSLTPGDERTLHLLLSKNKASHAELMDQFNRGLLILKEKGLVKRYIEAFYERE